MNYRGKESDESWTNLTKVDVKFMEFKEFLKL